MKSFKSLVNELYSIDDKRNYNELHEFVNKIRADEVLDESEQERVKNLVGRLYVSEHCDITNLLGDIPEELQEVDMNTLSKRDWDFLNLHKVDVWNYPYMDELEYNQTKYSPSFQGKRNADSYDEDDFDDAYYEDDLEDDEDVLYVDDDDLDDEDILYVDDDNEDDFATKTWRMNEEMSEKQKAKKEEIVKAMKKNKGELMKKYGDDWENVMYATATKKATEMNESVITANKLKELEKFDNLKDMKDFAINLLRQSKTDPRKKESIINDIKNYTNKNRIIKTMWNAFLAGEKLGTFSSYSRRMKESLDEQFSPGSMKLKDGSSVNISSKDAELLNDLFDTLEPQNKKKMEQELMKSKSDFQSILTFAKEV